MSDQSNRDDHTDEIYRLWRSIRRDIGTSILSFAGFDESDSAEKAWRRLVKNWMKLAELDINVFARLADGVEQVSMSLQTPHYPYDIKIPTGQSELAGIMALARERNPDAKIDSLRQLIELGEQAIQDGIDKLAGETA